MTPETANALQRAEEQGAVDAAVAAARAAAQRSGHRARASRSAADVLDERLDLDWSSFDSRGYRLLREVARRRGFGPREPADPRWDDHAEIGGKYEDRYSPARRRLARASA